MAVYDSAAGPVAKVQGTFEYSSSAPETPGPEIVVDSFVRLIETRPGERPFRTVPTVAMQPLLEAYKVAAAAARDAIAAIFGMSQATPVRSAHSGA